METRINPVLPDVVGTQSAPRPTPPPPQTHFQEVLAQSIITGAEQTVTSLPGGPLMAMALRGGTPVPLPTTTAGLPVPMSAPLTSSGLGVRTTLAPEGPISSGAGVATTGIGGSSVATSGVSGGDAGLQSSLAQSQELNLYYLQVQEQVNAQDRSYSALSNVLKTEHDTVKNAIGNLR